MDTKGLSERAMPKVHMLGRGIAREGNEFVRVEWIDDEGYRVVGKLQLVGRASHRILQTLSG